MSKIKPLNQVAKADIDTVYKFLQSNFDVEKFVLIMGDKDNSVNLLGRKGLLLQREDFCDIFCAMGYDNFHNLLLGLHDFIESSSDDIKPMFKELICHWLMSDFCDGDETAKECDSNYVDVTELLKNAGYNA